MLAKTGIGGFAAAIVVVLVGAAAFGAFSATGANAGVVAGSGNAASRWTTGDLSPGAYVRANATARSPPPATPNATRRTTRARSRAMFIAASTSSGTLGYGTSMRPGIIMTLLLISGLILIWTSR